MDHPEVRELIELAAVEPRGLDRLMAGDTPEAAAIAGHLAGCPECTAEMARIRRASEVIRDVVRSTPPPELRARTLAFVGAVGRVRGPDGRPATVPSSSSVSRPAATGVVIPFSRRWGGLAWVASLAAAIVLSVVASGLLLNNRLEAGLAERDAVIARQTDAITGLSKVSAWTVRLSGAPDAQRVALAGVGAEATGTLLFSSDTTELVVVANDLPQPPTDREFRCWVEVDGQRTAIGRMFFGGDLAYWAGEVPALTGLGDGAVFGVSLADATQPGDLGGEPVISGEL